MIYTLTLNPSIDYYMSIDNIALGEVNRSRGESLAFGGKGINVSRMLKRLERTSRAVAVVGSGSMSKVFLNGVKAEGLDVAFVRADGDIRINVKLKSEDTGITELNGTGVEATEATLNGIFFALKDVQEGDIVVMSGSICKGLPINIYQTLTTELNGRGVLTVVDADGEALALAVKAKPYLIKPNITEFKRLTGAASGDVKDLVTEARKLIDDGVKNVLLSMGSSGVACIYEGHCIRIPIRKLEGVNTVGAGDSLLAGFVSGYEITTADPSLNVTMGLISAYSHISGKPIPEDDEELFAMFTSQILGVRFKKIE